MPEAFRGRQAGSREGMPMAVTQDELVVTGFALTAASVDRRATRIW